MKLFIAGHHGMVGGAQVRRFQREPGATLLLRTRRELDLTNKAAVDAFYATEKPDDAIIAAAKVGGINDNNTYPAEFLFENLAFAANTIQSAHRAGTKRLLFLGSSCIYPNLAPQPMPEDCLLTGPLEPTNEWYAVAKIAGIKLCQAYRRQYGCDFISAMPTNLYGPGDNFDLQSSHVLPALIRKAHEARLAGAQSIEIWGTGSPRREFLHVDDLADACAMLLQTYSGESHVNVGSGEDVTILELARMVMDAVGFEGEIVRDTGKPDGAPRKLMSAERLKAMGWSPSIPLPEGIAATYRWFLEHRA
jgi:GDP-L-fucose synthase